MTATGKDTIIKHNNKQCTKWQKHNIQYRQLCVHKSDMFKFEMKK